MKNLNYLNDYRVSFKDEKNGDEYNGMFQLRVNGTPVLIIASNGMDWEHVSVSHNNRVPSWEIMCKVKEMFFNNDEIVMQLHPKKSEYVNLCKNCLHLWKPISQQIPTPPIKLV